jgi:putative ABC transport system permease protein
MAWLPEKLSEFGRRLLILLRGEQIDRELDEEMRLHRELRERDRRKAGASADEAFYAVQRHFGNTLQLRERGHAMWGWKWLEDFFQDTRFGLRSLRKNPGFSAVTILTLALGIGANTAIFSLIDTVMLRMLPVQKPEELVQVVRSSPRSGGVPSSYFTNPIWEQVRDHQEVFSSVMTWGDQRFDLSQGGESHFVNGLYVSGDYFNTLGVRPAAGRLLTPRDDVRGCAGAVVLSYGFWRDHFGRAENAIGSSLSLNHIPFSIIGVAQPGFFGVDVGQNFDVAIPICTEAIIDGKGSMLDHRSAWWIRVLGRPKPGITPEQATAGLRVMSPGVFTATVPQNWKPDIQKTYQQITLSAVPGGRGLSDVRQAYNQPLRMMMGIVGLVLLIACANIASLMLARSATRRKEIAVRLAVGASRFRLIRQLLTECVMLSFAGAVLGILFARWGSFLLIRFISTTRDPVFLDMSLDPRILGFAAGIAVLTGLLFGVLPALRSTKVSLSSAMKGGQSSEAESRAHLRPGRWIVASQVALSLVLLIVAGLFLHSFTNLINLDIGFDRSNVLIINANGHQLKLHAEESSALFKEILARLKSLPGTESASMSVLTPISDRRWNSDFHLQSGGGPTGDDTLANMNYVSPGYFTTLRSPILAGRDFNDHDVAGAPNVAVINETMARRFFPQTDPLGKYLLIEDMPGTTTPPFQVIGILKDAKYGSLREETEPTIYFPVAQLAKSPGPGGVIESLTFEIRATSRPSALARGAAEAIAGVNKSISLTFRTLEEQVDDSLRQEQLLATLSGFFGGLALLLAMIGLYGVMAYMVTQRQKEIGIRMALGAGSSSIVRLVLRTVGFILVVGVVAGVGISIATTRLLQKMLFNVSAHDTWTILVAVSVLAAVALIAGYFPARRASRLDPMAILRNE